MVHEREVPKLEYGGHQEQCVDFVSEFDVGLVFEEIFVLDGIVGGVVVSEPVDFSN